MMKFRSSFVRPMKADAEDVPLIEENTFRILIASDNHLGFAEKDGIRGLDSFKSFEEILHVAKTENVDFIFLGGDIFHDSRPSMFSMHEAIRLFRTYCFNDNPVRFELLSDQDKVFPNICFRTMNYLDPNVNVGLPVFAIHGNHDDPSGPGGLCAADILHAAGCLNLLGKITSVEQICVEPLLLRKGSSKLAIYPLGAIREERAHRLFLNNMVTFLRPKQDADSWFSLCAVHQNRSRHGPTNYLPEKFLPNFLDLIIWGHEHECRIEPEWNSSQNFFVSQPGSSVATALSEGESKPKAIGLLEIKGKEFKITRIPLQSVRPFIFMDISVEDELKNCASKQLDIAKEVLTVCERKVENALADFSSLSGKNDGTRPSSKNNSSSFLGTVANPVHCTPKEPLVRLRVDVSGGFETFSSLRFGQRFIGRIANPKDLVTFNHNREKLAAVQARRALTSGLEAENEQPSNNLDQLDRKKVGLDATEVGKLIRLYLTEVAASSEKLTDSGSLSLFTCSELGSSLKRFVEKDSRDAIDTIVELIMKNTVKHLRVRKCPEEHILPDIIAFCQSRNVVNTQTGDHEEDEIPLPSLPSESTSVTTKPGFPSKSVDVEWSSDEDIVSESKKTKGNPRTNNSRKVVKRPASTSLDVNSSLLENDSSSPYSIDEDDSPPPIKTRTRRPEDITHNPPVPTRGRSRSRARGTRARGRVPNL